MRVTTIIAALTAGTIATAILIPEISPIMGAIAVILSFFLIMAVIINLGNPFKVSRYVIHKGWHYSVQSVITFLFPFVRSYKGGGITAIINNYAGNKYERTSDRNPSLAQAIFPEWNVDGNNPVNSWNKFFGLSYGMNPHKNSMRLAWRHFTTDYYECCWYYYVDGNRYESKPFILEYGKDYNISIQKMLCSARRMDGDTLSEFAYFGNAVDNSYVLMPYFGGKRRAPKKMIFKAEIK